MLAQRKYPQLTNTAIVDVVSWESIMNAYSLLCLNQDFIFFFLFYFSFKLYIIVLVLPNIKMNPPQEYMCSPSWTLLPPPSPYHPSGSYFKTKFMCFLYIYIIIRQYWIYKLVSNASFSSYSQRNWGLEKLK